MKRLFAPLAMLMFLFSSGGMTCAMESGLASAAMARFRLGDFLVESRDMEGHRLAVGLELIHDPEMAKELSSRTAELRAKVNTILLKFTAQRLLEDCRDGFFQKDVEVCLNSVLGCRKSDIRIHKALVTGARIEFAPGSRFDGCEVGDAAGRKDYKMRLQALERDEQPWSPTLKGFHLGEIPCISGDWPCRTMRLDIGLDYTGDLATLLQERAGELKNAVVVYVCRRSFMRFREEVIDRLVEFDLKNLFNETLDISQSEHRIRKVYLSSFISDFPPVPVQSHGKEKMTDLSPPPGAAGKKKGK